MPRFLILGLLIASVGCSKASKKPTPRTAALKILAQNDTQPPALSSELSKYDDRAQAWFLVGNDSNREITVTLASKTCTCVDLMLDGKTIEVATTFPLAPGQKKRVEVNGRLDPAPGVHRFGADLRADDGSVVNLLGNRTVYADLEPTPNLLMVPMRRDESIGAGTIEITHTFRSQETKSMAPTADGTPNGVTVVSISPQDEPKELEPGLWQQVWDANLRLELRQLATTPTYIGFILEGAEARVPIKVTQAFGIVAPEIVTFGSVDLGSCRKRRVLMHSIGRTPFKVEKIEVEPGEVETSVTESGQGRYWVDLSFQPSQVGERHARLLVQTDHPESPQVSIDIIGSGRSPTGGANQ